MLYRRMFRCGGTLGAAKRNQPGFLPGVNARASARDQSEALLARAHALGADLLVMSAYPHSPLREFVLGGVSRFMLEHADLPLLMRHWQGRTGPGR